MIGYFFWDPPREMIPIVIPGLGRPIVWYGFLFALGVMLSYSVLKRSFDAFFSAQPEFEFIAEKKDQKKFWERLATYVLIGSIIGAKIIDVLFYQNLEFILKNPLDVFAFWKPGLSSHGGTIGVCVGLWILSRKSNLSFLRLMDICVMPAALTGCFIRIGNFFNQEILGKVTDAPWAVIFGHPVDGLIAPRHPVQLYESIAYFTILIILWYSCRLFRLFEIPGRVAGLFFFLVFGVRFFLEIFKVEQSIYLDGQGITMGQYLSIPFVLYGGFLLFRQYISDKARIKWNHR